LDRIASKWTRLEMVENGKDGSSRLIPFPQKHAKCVSNPIQGILIEVCRRVDEPCNWK